MSKTLEMPTQGQQEPTTGYDPSQAQQNQEDLSLQQAMAELEREEEEELQNGYDAGYVPESQIPSGSSVEEDAYAYDTEAIMESDGVTIQADELSEEAAVEEPEYTNFLSRLFDGMADAMGKDTELGQTLSQMADQMEKGFSGKNPKEEAAKTDTQEDLLNRDVSDFEQKSDADLVGMDAEELADYAQDARAYEAQRVEAANQPVDGMSTEEAMAWQAKDAVAMEDLLDAADATEFPTVTSSMERLDFTLSTRAMGVMSGVDVGDEQKATVSDMYMDVMRGVEAYSDAATQAIEEQYADDPEKKQQATQGLENLMRQTVGESYGMIYKADNTYDFLSEADRKELDSMDIAGVNASYSDYEQTKQYLDEKTVEPEITDEAESEDESLYDPDQAYTEEDAMYGEPEWDMETPYGDSGFDRGEPQTNAEPHRENLPYVPGSESGYTRVNRKEQTSRTDRGAQAEERFGSIVEADEQSKVIQTDRQMGE